MLFDIKYLVPFIALTGLTSAAPVATQNEPSSAVSTTSEGLAPKQQLQITIRDLETELQQLQSEAVKVSKRDGISKGTTISSSSSSDDGVQDKSLNGLFNAIVKEIRNHHKRDEGVSEAEADGVQDKSLNGLFNAIVKEIKNHHKRDEEAEKTEAVEEAGAFDV